MGELKDVLKSIEDHCSAENRMRCTNLSIGRGEMLLNGYAPQTIYILNTDTLPYSHGISRDITGAAITTFDTGKKPFYFENGTVVVPKNRQFAQILLQNYEGHHSCVFTDHKTKSFLIKSSAHYNNTGSSVIDLYVGTSGMKNWSYFSSLQKALSSLREVDESIRLKKIAEEEAKRKAEELRKKKLEEEARKAEIEAQKLENEIKEAQAKREAVLSEAAKASDFIRKQVSLKRNPVLDKHQNSAKFSNLYNGVAEVIDGGPGTGKTTTMIQRLKLLIDKDDLLDYVENHPDCGITASQLEVISSSQDNWIFFSPNDLLKKYLQDNMSYEGLTNISRSTAVWKDFLKDAVRDRYHLAGSDCPFDFMGRKNESRSIFVGDHLLIVENFTKFVLSQVKERFLKVAKIDCSGFSWRILGRVITQECAKIESVNSIDELLRFLIRMDGIDNRVSVGGESVVSGSVITSMFNERTRELSDRYIALLKRDEEKYNEVLEYTRSLMKTPQPEVEEGEEPEEIEPDFGDLSIALFNRMNPLLKKLALRIKDKNAKLTGSQVKLLEFVKDVVNEEDLKSVADAAFFVKYLNPALKGFSQYVLNPIPNYYKAYRKSMSEDDKKLWDQGLLQEMVEVQKNKKLYGQEQSLLVGFINNIAKALYRASRERFEKATHKYIDAYKELCRPVIGVDEATDYSLIEYYGIKSFGHYQVCSYTLCGDTMQLMKEDGITDWSQLQRPLLFEKLEVKNLLMSYRQSEELLKLADMIYLEEKGHHSPYQCFLKGGKTPRPLWLEWEDMDEKAQWIANRVIEIVKAYNCVPTIAIFTIDKKKAEELKESLDECDNLIQAGIDVKVCSDNTLEGEKALRIFPIDQVKGMEFEAVFFYDIDDIESSSLINKYLYVGLSRASMYLAVTSNGRSEKISDMLQKYFAVDETW